MDQPENNTAAEKQGARDDSEFPSFEESKASEETTVKKSNKNKKKNKKQKGEAIVFELGALTSEEPTA